MGLVYSHVGLHLHAAPEYKFVSQKCNKFVSVISSGVNLAFASPQILKTSRSLIYSRRATQAVVLHQDKGSYKFRATKPKHTKLKSEPNLTETTTRNMKQTTTFLLIVVAALPVMMPKVTSVVSTSPLSDLLTLGSSNSRSSASAIATGSPSRRHYQRGFHRDPMPWEDGYFDPTYHAWPKLGGSGGSGQSGSQEKSQ